MREDSPSSCAQRSYFKAMLFVSLVLSQTQLLVNLKGIAPTHTVPYFTLAYFILSTAHLAFVFLRYGFAGQRDKGAVLEWYQSLGLPLSVLLLSMLGRGQGLVYFKASCAVILVIQSLILTGKIIYFNSVTPELAQISTINKLVRVVKLNIIGLLPLIVEAQLVVVVVVALCQTISICAFFLKFTYQKCIYEYVLLVCVFCGFISALQNIFSTIFVLPYLFIGELVSLLFFLHHDNFLRSALELKYCSSLVKNSENKQDDQILAGMLFVEECLFDNKRTLKISESAKNQGAIQANAVMDRVRTGQSDASLYCQLAFQLQNIRTHREVSCALFQAYCQRFHQTDSFNCFQFTVGSALQLGGGFTSKALVLYYNFIEKKKSKASVFEGCKFQYAYVRIIKQVETKEVDKEHINFIEFSDNLRMLGNEMEECLGNELKLVEYLADRNRKAEMMADARIFTRSKLKEKIRSRLELCISQGIYFSSNQFKFLFLLYHISVEKRYLNLREQLKVQFLASQVQQLRYEGSEKSLIVLAGFNHGEIINSNEVFKNHFGLALSSFTRTNISEFIPTERQRAKHAALMAEAVEFKIQEPSPPHATYQCRLAIQKQLGSFKLKVVQTFSIGVRIYYQNSGSFNYICSLAPIHLHPQSKQRQILTLLRRDCRKFSSKGIQFSVVQQTSIEQLDEHLELTDIEFNFEISDHRFSSIRQRTPEKKERSQKVERYLEEKTARIQKKMMEKGREEYKYTFSNVIQASVIVFFGIFIFMALASSDRGIDNLKTSISQLFMPAESAQLVRSKMLIQQQILGLQVQTQYFPDDICTKNGIPSIKGYITKTLYQDLQENTDEFISSLSYPHDFAKLSQNLYTRGYTSMPFLANPIIPITYQKTIQLLKAQIFQWLSTIKDKTFDYIFYSQVFSSIMLESTIDGKLSLVTQLQSSQNQYIKQMTATLSHLNAISLVLVAILGALTVFLRIRDNRALIDFLAIVECIPSSQLNDRIWELKSAITQLHQVKANRIESIEFDHSFIVQIKSDKHDTEAIPLEEFAEWHIRTKAEYELEDSEDSYGELDKEFGQHQKCQEPALASSKMVRLVKYKKTYLALASGLLVCIMLITDSVVAMQRARLDSLVLCSAASLELSNIQQKFINLAAYNWLKVLSLQQDFNMTVSRMMYLEAISSLLNSNYLSKIPSAYSKQISDQVLFGDVCGFFKDPKSCVKYRNNIFSSGLSMLIPFVVKEMVQIDQISSNYTYYTHNMCDKTWLLFDGIVPLTNNISTFGFNTMTGISEQGFVAKYLQIASAVIVLLVVTVAFQYQRYRRERIIKEEVFSLDTVQNLYSVAEFKPYFNKIYYS